MTADVDCAIPGLRSRVTARREREHTKERLLRLFAAAPKAYWRHDVDLSLRAAVDMGRVAQLAGISSTFFLDPRSEHYNLFSRAGAHAIAELREAGHRFGLHCDFRAGNVKERVRADFRLLDVAYPSLFGRRVSFHMPPPQLLWLDLGPEFESAYAPLWKGNYISDSRGLLPDDQELHDELQINLHPEWWL